MTRFVKKPLVVEAERYIEPDGGIYYGPDQAVREIQQMHLPVGVCVCLASIRPHIETLGAVVPVDPGDWIITEPDGRRYVCRPWTFEQMYEPVEGAD